MNLNIVNLDCKDWSRADWNDAYAQYCAHNQFGPMNKREYFNFVNERHNQLRKQSEAPSQDFLDEHARGWRNAVQWAKKHGCDMNGRLLVDIGQENRDNNALETALRAEDIAVDTQQRLDYLIERVRK